MIISKTPLRISFVGGGSDIDSFYEKFPGAVVSTTINKYIYIAVNKKFDQKIRASYSITEIVNNVNELRHDLIRECLKLLGIDGGIEITSISDIPSSGTGLGSSSSYTVGLLNALHAFKGEQVTAAKLAEEACKIEIEILRKPIGKQDQYAAAYGGLNLIQFLSNGSVTVEPIIYKKETKEELEKNLLLFYSGITRSANRVLSEQKVNVETKKDIVNNIKTMVELANTARTILMSNNLGRVGELIHQNWLLKRELASSVSSSAIDRLYETARKHGATGGKILGAGGGGFILIYAPHQKQETVIKSLPTLRLIPFKIEPHGSRIINVN